MSGRMDLFSGPAKNELQLSYQSLSFYSLTGSPQRTWWCSMEMKLSIRNWMIKACFTDPFAFKLEPRKMSHYPNKMAARSKGTLGRSIKGMHVYNRPPFFWLSPFQCPFSITVRLTVACKPLSINQRGPPVLKGLKVTGLYQTTWTWIYGIEGSQRSLLKKLLMTQ